MQLCRLLFNQNTICIKITDIEQVVSILGTINNHVFPIFFYHCKHYILVLWCHPINAYSLILDFIELIFVGNPPSIVFINELGDAMPRYKAAGIRLDSGDLAYLSSEARKIFCIIEKEFGVPGFGKMVITASNDLNEETLDALNKQVMALNL